MGEENEKPGAGRGPRAFAGSGEGGAGHVERGFTGPGPEAPLFDHEKLEVYQVAREFLRVLTDLLRRKMPGELRDQVERASWSVLFNIGEGAGKTARSDKQRSYEIARGSATEVAAQLDVLVLRGIITDTQYHHARSLLVRVAQMLSRLCGPLRR